MQDTDSEVPQGLQEDRAVLPAGQGGYGWVGWAGVGAKHTWGEVA